MRESMWIILLAVLLIANVGATFLALRSDTATPTQRALQTFFVWMVPLLGAFVVILFHRLDRRSQGPEPERARLDGNEIDVGMAARHDGHH
jgi:Na+/proline symporter